MNILDIALLVSAGIGFILGYRAGLVKQLSFGAGIAIGLLQAVLFYEQGAAKLQEMTEWNETLCTVLSFIIIMLTVATMLIILGIIIRWILTIILLGIVDSILGAILSTFIATGIFVVVVNISADISPDNRITGKTTQKESLLYKEIAQKTFLIIEGAKID